MENTKDKIRQINAVIEILKDAHHLCEDAATEGLINLALEGSETLQQLMMDAEWPGLPEGRLTAEPGLLPLPGEAFPAGDPADLCFPV